MGRQVESSEQQRRAFGAAVEAAMYAARISSFADLSRRLAEVGVERHEQTVGQWCKGLAEPRRSEVFAIERVCEVEPGTLSRHLGYVPVDADPTVTLDQLIAADPDLTEQDRHLVLGVLRSIRKS